MHRKHITQNPVRLRFHSYSSQCCRRRCLHISTDNIYANGTFMGGIYCVFRSADVLWIWWTNTLWPYDVRISWRRWHWIIAHGKFPRDKLLFSIENLDWLVFFFCFRWMHVCSPTSLLILRNRIAMHWFFNHFFFFSFNQRRRTNLWWNSVALVGTVLKFQIFSISFDYFISSTGGRFHIETGGRRRCKRTRGGVLTFGVYRRN